MCCLSLKSRLCLFSWLFRSSSSNSCSCKFLMLYIYKLLAHIDSLTHSNINLLKQLFKKIFTKCINKFVLVLNTTKINIHILLAFSFIIWLAVLHYKHSGTLICMHLNLPLPFRRIISNILLMGMWQSLCCFTFSLLSMSISSLPFMKDVLFNLSGLKLAYMLVMF